MWCHKRGFDNKCELTQPGSAAQSDMNDNGNGIMADLKAWANKEYNVHRGKSFDSEDTNSSIVNDSILSLRCANGNYIEDSSLNYADNQVSVNCTNPSTRISSEYAGTAKKSTKCIIVFDHQTESFILERYSEVFLTSVPTQKELDQSADLVDMDDALDAGFSAIDNAISSPKKTRVPIALRDLVSSTKNAKSESSDDSGSESGSESSRSSGYSSSIGLLILSQVAVFYGFKMILSSLDPSRSKRLENKSKIDNYLAKLGVKHKLNEHEEIIASELVTPDEITSTFSSIGGLEPIISDLKETVIYPLMYPQLYSSASNLLGAPKGVLLYGPPGCGKTLLAKALAKESGATFINLHVSTLTEKWFGESQKLVRGLFTLAKKLQPSIIFIDEIDSFLRERGKTDHEATAMMKAEFMTHWDGLGTSDNSRIIVLGATNRPNDIDGAILRRMPKKFSVGLPENDQRRKILEI
ncbi:hypothetical protein HK096_005048, partial [Nowakowskiella sp. JEL0078]